VKPLTLKNILITSEMKMKRIKFIAACWFLLLSFTSHSVPTLPTDLVWLGNETAKPWSSHDSKTGGTFTNFILSFPPTLRTVGPDSNSAFRSYINANQLGLTSYHPNTMEVIPQIATHWAYGQDGKTVYYKLDPKAKWSDGPAVTAEDFLFTLDLMRSKHINAPWYNNHYSKEITSATIYDDHTISITGRVAKPKEELHYYYGLTPTPKYFYKKITANWVKNYNWKIIPNTGPYQISEIKKGKKVTFKKKQNWWAKDRPLNKNRYNVNKVVLKVIRDVNIAYKHFEKGELDSFGLVQPEFWHNKAKGYLYDNGYLEKFVFYNDTPRSSTGLFLNTASPLLKDKNIRIALAHSLNFDRVIKTILRGDYERLNAFHTGYGEFSNPNIKARAFDLAKSNTLLDQSGWSHRDGGGIRIKNDKRLSIDLVYGRKEHSDRWAILKQDALKAGIELNLKLQDSSSHYKTIMQKQHQIAALGWSTGFRPAFWQHFHSENANKPQTNNITNTDDKSIDANISGYRSETDNAKRIDFAKALAQEIHDEAVFIPSFMVPYTRGAHWRWLKLPKVPGTKTSNTLYSPFGNGGIFWIESATKIKTKTARKNKTKYPIIESVFDNYSVSKL
jgi:microcin C transport system substrate-binding protein